MAAQQAERVSGKPVSRYQAKQAVYREGAMSNPMGSRPAGLSAVHNGAPAGPPALRPRVQVAITDGVMRAVPARPAPVIVAAPGGIIGVRTWQPGKVVSFTDGRLGSGVVEVGGVQYPLPAFQAYISKLTSSVLVPGADVYVRLRRKDNRPEVHSIKLAVPADVSPELWYAGTMMGLKEGSGCIVERLRYLAVRVAWDTLERCLDLETLCDGLKVEVQVDEGGATSPQATAIRLARV